MHVQTIIEALKKLDPETEDHWTTDGAPRLDVLEADLPGVTRKMVLEAAPLFHRKNPVTPDLAAEREAAEAAMQEAQDAEREAKEKREKAAAASAKVAAHEREIRDRHTLTRQNRQWIKSQLEADATRAAHQRVIDQAVRNAGGINLAGVHPIDRNTAIRNRAARRNIVIQAKKD